MSSPQRVVAAACDTVETQVAWKLARLRTNAPPALALSRQNLPFVPRSDKQNPAIERGGCVLEETARGMRQRILTATGSEAGRAFAAQRILEGEGIAARVVSMPMAETFDRKDAAYRAKALPDAIAKTAIDAAATALWWKYVRGNGAAIDIDRYGEFAPADPLFAPSGLTAVKVADAASCA